jgi:hypothetical protein
VLLVLAAAVAGCAGETPPISSLAPASALAITASPAAAATVEPASQSYRKTMSDRVLAAIALERVTGMKPDPARLVVE